MLTLPQIVQNPPKQPLVPSALLRNLTGVTSWWTTHEPMSFLNPQGYREIRPSAGSTALLGNALESTTPATFRSVSLNGRTYSPYWSDGANPRNLLRGSVAFNPQWNSVVMAFRGIEGHVGDALANFVVNPSATTPLNVRLLPAATASAAGLYGVTSGNTNSHFANPAAVNEVCYQTFAFNLTTGQVKYAKNSAAAEVQSNTALVNVVPDALSTFTFGGRNASLTFQGDWLDLGIFSGVDLFAATTTRTDIQTYMTNLYGIA